jgi:copper transport protein
VADRRAIERGTLPATAVASRPDRPLSVPLSLLVRRRPTSLAALSACLLAVGQAIAVGISGHTGGATTPTPAGVALRAAHLLAVGAWIGALVAMAVVLADLRQHPAWCSPGRRQELLRRFSAVAASGLAAVVITGLLLTGAEVSTITALLTTWYGSILILKLAVVAVVALVGLHHARLIRHRPLLDKQLRRTLPFEALGGLIAIMLGAALGATSPARGPQFEPQPAPRPSTITTTSADLVIRVSLEPNRPGRNLLAVDLFNTRRPAPAPIGHVVVSLRTPASGAAGALVKLTKVSDSHWDGGAVNIAPGGLGMDVLVQRTGLAPNSTSVPWTVNGPKLWHQPTVVSSAPLAPLDSGAAAAVALIALAACVVSRRRSRLLGRRAKVPQLAWRLTADSSQGRAAALRSRRRYTLGGDGHAGDTLLAPPEL